jgi:hypothetical protein
VPKGKAYNELPAPPPRWQKSNVALPEGYAVYRADMAEIQEPPKTLEHTERLICLVEAYDDNVFRNSVALAVWSLFRVLCPKLRPWHAVDHTKHYPGDDPAQREARESDLASLTNCAVFGAQKKNVSLDHLVCSGPRRNAHKHQPLGHLGDRLGLRYALQRAVARADSLGQE